MTKAELIDFLQNYPIELDPKSGRITYFGYKVSKALDNLRPKLHLMLKEKNNSYQLTESEIRQIDKIMNYQYINMSFENLSVDLKPLFLSFKREGKLSKVLSD